MMIGKLSYGVGLDFSQLDRDAARADKLIGGIGSGASKEIATPKGAAGPDAGALADRLTATLKGGGFGEISINLTKEFDRVGGAMISMFRRIDAAMKFPTIDAAFATISGRLTGVGNNAVRAMGLVVSGAIQATTAATRLSDVFGVVTAAGATIGTVVAGRMLAIVGAAGYAAGAVVKLGQGVYRVTNYLGSMGDVAKKTFTQLFHLGTLGIFRKMGADAAAARGAVGGLGASIRSIGRDLLVAFGAAGVIYKLVGWLKAGVKSASDLNESVSASKQVFGSSFGAINDQVERNAKAFGLTKKAQLDAASGFGSIAQGAGFSEQASAKFANTFGMLAADLASFKNISFAEATQKISSSLAGQSEPLRQFGVLIDEDAVKTYALSHGLAKSAKTLDNHAKMAARAALIQQGLSAASGDLARTADSAANQFRMAGGGMANFAEKVGAVLLPAVNLATESFNELLATTIEVFEANLPTIENWASYITSAIKRIGKFVRNFGLYWQIAQLSATQAISNIVAVFQTFPANFRIITAYIGRNWFDLLVDLANAERTAFFNLLDNAQAFGAAFWDAIQGKGFNFEWKGLLTGFEATAEKLPDLIEPVWVSMENEMNALFDQIESNELARAQNVAKAMPKAKDTLNPAAEIKKDVERKLAAAVEIGSKESYSIVAANRVGGGKDSGIKTVAGNTKQGNEIAREHLNWVKNHPNGFNVETAGI